MLNNQSSEKKNIKLTDKSFLRLFVTSILAIAICIICLCSSTWAWFTQSITGAGNELKAADTCLISISVVDENGTELTDLENGVDLTAGVRYTVTISLPKDSASGYYIILPLGSNDYEIEIGTESESETVDFIETETEIETDSFLETETETESESDIETGVDTESESGSETESASVFNMRAASEEPGAERVYYTYYIARHDSDEDKTVTFTLISSRNQRVMISSRWGIYSGDCDVDENGILKID